MRKRLGLSPLQLVFLTAATIFTSAVAVMMFFRGLRTVPPLQHTLLEASLIMGATFPVLYLCVYRPMMLHLSARIRAEAKVARGTIYDSLTHLPNRLFLVQQIEHQKLVAEREGTSFVITLLEIHRLTEINETLGHHIGDTVIREVALRLKDNLRQSDIVARVGGNEFVVLLPSRQLNYTLIQARKLQQIIEEPIYLEDVPIAIESSFGIVKCSDRASDPEELLRRAGAAKQHAKRDKDGVRVYEHDTNSASRRALSLFTHLKHAIASATEISLHYQPKVRVECGQVVSVEALARWTHPELGSVSPGEFIPVVENTSLARPFTTLVLDTAFEQLAKWKWSDIDVSIAINLMARDIQDERILHLAEGLLEKWGVSASDIEFEITESAAMAQPQKTMKILNQLRDAGFSLAIDDYGTGYSSLKYLAELPVDTLKIDLCFDRDMVENAENAAIVKSTIELAHNLGLMVVAEGVEDEATWNELKLLGCDIIQGYYCGRPTPAREFEALLK